MSIPAGRWRVTITPPDSDLALTFRCGSMSMQREAVGSVAIFQLDQPSAIGVGVVPSAARMTPAAVDLISFIEEKQGEPIYHCVRPRERLTTTLTEIATPKPEHLSWAHPTNLVISDVGLSVVMDRPQKASMIEISTDNNDVYQINLEHRGRSIWTDKILPRQNGGGLAVNHLVLPTGTKVETGDQLLVTPSGGDGAFSIGHLRFSD